jgi:hypothetical protein
MPQQQHQTSAIKPPTKSAAKHRHAIALATAQAKKKPAKRWQGFN